MGTTKERLIREVKEGKGLGARMAVRELRYVDWLWKGQPEKYRCPRCDIETFDGDRIHTTWYDTNGVHCTGRPK